MCGIIGAVAERNILKILLEALKRMEYRGYDSAGMVLLQQNELKRLRRVGKVAELEKAVTDDLSGHTGIAHTRWATHGAPTEENAHPHTAGDWAVVHNGIIENHQALREECLTQGCIFSSETDTEVIAHLLNLAMQTQSDWLQAVQSVIQKLEGAYGLAVIHRGHPDELIAVRSGSPLVIGLGIGENFVASDVTALLSVTNRFIYLEEGDLAHITRTDISIVDVSGQSVTRDCDELQETADAACKGQYKHYMQKEIFEQPEAVAKTLATGVSEQAFGAAAADLLPQVKHVKIIACGTSYHAGLIAKYWFESWGKVSCDVEVASEYRYRDAVVSEGTLLVVISQSGETADTLAAMRLAKSQGYVGTLAICNVATSSMVREADMVFLTQAGVEIGVASTKAFTTQLIALYLLVLRFVKDDGERQHLLDVLHQLPELLKQILKVDGYIQSLVACFIEKQHCLFLGRGVHYPLAMEGALKLKEISYIHAEAYPAGELKHGPLALVDKDMPVVAIAPNDELLEKLKANLSEVEARGGQLYVLTEKELGEEWMLQAKFIHIPTVPNEISAIVYTIPLQLLSYHVACVKGTDVDQPRNLAKSVTVE